MNKEDKIIDLLLQQGEKIEKIEFGMSQMITRDEFLNSHDKIIKELKKLDQERVFAVGRMDRIEKSVGERGANK